MVDQPAMPQAEKTIYDDICCLQDLIQMESELRQTFHIRFHELIPKLRLQIENYSKTQATLVSDLELFRYSA